MNKLIILFSLLMVSCSYNNCKSTSPVKELQYVYVLDTITLLKKQYIIDSLNNKCVELRDSVIFIKDSISNINDEINTDLYIANYKLARIKYYNDIAGKGNNIKYLRGWINRVINDK